MIEIALALPPIAQVEERENENRGRRPCDDGLTENDPMDLPRNSFKHAIAAGKLQKLGVITYRRGQIAVLDRPRLEQLCCECYGVVKKETDRLLPLHPLHLRGEQPNGPLKKRALAMERETS